MLDVPVKLKGLGTQGVEKLLANAVKKPLRHVFVQRLFLGLVSSENLYNQKFTPTHFDHVT